VREQLFQCNRRGSGPVQVSPSHWRFISAQACRNDERVAFLQLVGVSAERLLCLEALDMCKAAVLDEKSGETKEVGEAEFWLASLGHMTEFEYSV